MDSGVEDTRTQDFDAMMRDAQVAYKEGRYTDSRNTYYGAYLFSPEGLERARALRGFSAGEDMLGNRELAIDVIENQVIPMSQAAITAAIESGKWSIQEPAFYNALRERADTFGVLGKLVLKQAVDLEIAHGRSDARELGERAINHFLNAQAILRDSEKSSAHPGGKDQYFINLMPRYAWAEFLFGKLWKGRKTAIGHEAFALAQQSEAKGNPTSANLGDAYRKTSQKNAKWRARTARMARFVIDNHIPFGRAVSLRVARKIL